MAGFAKFALQSIMVEPVLQYFADRNVRREYPRTVIVSGDYVGRWIQIAGCYEEHVLNVVSEFLRERLDCKALTCIDIGANIGNHTAWFARMFGKVLAIEASPRIFEVLKINAAPYDNARCINVAVGERTGKGLISLVEETNEGTGRVRELSREPADAGGRGITCDIFRLDDLIAEEDGRIGLIKIDVEGMEQSVLHGAAAVIAKNRPIVLFEYYPDQNKDECTFEIMRRYGYKKFYFVGTAFEFSTSNILDKFISFSVSFLLNLRFRLREVKGTRREYGMVVAVPD